MEALKYKIFEVLTKKITVSEFENWLYNTEEFLNKIDSNLLYFNVISINYKNEKWALELNNLAKQHFDCDYLEILQIKMSCLGILKSETFDEIHKILTDLTQEFNYDTDYIILWRLYSLKDYFDLVEGGIWEIGTYLSEAKFYAKQTVEIIIKNKGFKELKTALEFELEPFENFKIKQKAILKQKMFAFLKKI